MNFYGVRRLVLINSGNYVYADVDLSSAVHFAAPNNRGKSTLVNALQFLYIDDFDKMRFGRRSHDDTRRHYFGDDQSYLIFECHAPSGPQCMLVHGAGVLRGGGFERYVYDGEYRKADYIDDEEIRDFEAIRGSLADRHLARVKNSELWQVLTGGLPPQNGKSLPRLNILPIRRQEEYVAFRNVFVRLLSLSNADSRALRQLVIDAHAREVGERKIDVAAEYKKEFERAERADYEFNFIRSVTEQIDQGRELRLDLRVRRDFIAVNAPQLWISARHAIAAVEEKIKQLNIEEEAIDGEQASIGTREKIAFESRGGLKHQQATLNQQWDQLHVNREQWSTYSPELIQAMRENLARLAGDLGNRQLQLDKAQVVNVEILAQVVDRLSQELAVDRKVIKNWGKTAGACLLRGGATEAEIDAAFHVINPDLLKLIQGEDLTIKDLGSAVNRIRSLGHHINHGAFSDDTFEIDLSKVSGPDSEALRDPDRLQGLIAMKEEELSRQTQLLDAASDQAKARSNLMTLQADYAHSASQLSDYDNHERAWAERPELRRQIAEVKKKLSTLDGEITRLGAQKANLEVRASDIANQLSQLNDWKSNLSNALVGLRDLLGRIGVDLDQGEIVDVKDDDPSRRATLGKVIESKMHRISELTKAATQIVSDRSQLQALQEEIEKKSCEFDFQRRYFSDASEEWHRLIEMRESLSGLEQASAKNWDALFTTLGARLTAVVTAVSNIKTAVQRINRGLKAFQVSNLLAVEIHVEEGLDVYHSIESLSKQGTLFQSRDDLEIAKKRLRQMIEGNQVIDLETLFELRIRIQQTDESWHQAASLDEIGSTGTGMTVKAMIFIQLVRAIAGDQQYRLHFYIDGLGELDDRNLEATAAMAVSRGIVSITADPRLHLEPLAHPDVTVYSLGQKPTGRFYIDGHRTYRARRLQEPVETGRE